MKGNKKYKELEELFRDKLEGEEIIPSGSLKPALMRSLGRMEFMRFIPTRFNIWYLGGIVATGAALALVLVTGSGEDRNVQQSLTVETEGHSEIIINQGNAISPELTRVNTDDNKQVIVSEQENIAIKDKNVVPGTEKGSVPAIDNLNSILKNVSGVLSEKDIIGGQIGRKDKLQPGIRQVNNLITASVIRGCAPLSVRFKAVTDSFSICRWSFGDGGFSNEREPVWLFDIEGEYTVQLQILDNEGINLISSTRISVNPQPVARFEFMPENAIIPDDEIIFHNYSSGAVKYKWDFGDGNSSEIFEPRYSYRKFDNYNVKLVALSESGCADTAELTNAYAGSGYYISFPNAFIPNSEGPSGGYYSPKSDEAAQVFHPAFSGVTDYQLKIFTRRGILIFETDEINIGWDGYFKGQLSEPGVYIWKVRGSFINGEPFTKMGDVTLLKN